MIARERGAGRARSRKELALWATSARCPDCSGMLVDAAVHVAAERAPAVAADTAVVARVIATCTTCNIRWELGFAAAPGWGDPLDDDDVRIATGAAPSTLIAEERWFELLDAAVARVRAAGDPAHPRLRAAWETVVYHETRTAIGLLLELEKLGWTNLDELARFLVHRFRFVGGTLPPELAARHAR